jgi:hypothetical protein
MHSLLSPVRVEHTMRLAGAILFKPRELKRLGTDTLQVEQTIRIRLLCHQNAEMPTKLEQTPKVCDVPYIKGCADGSRYNRSRQ